MTPAEAMDPPAPASASGQRTLAIAGRPNTGKTTLFNALTGLRQRVANFAGVTVEKAVGTLGSGAAKAEVVDLPGSFSLSPASEDERVALDFLLGGAARGEDLRVLCLAEASNLTQDLAFALGVKALGLQAALVVNMIDEARSDGVRVDAALLAREAGLPVFLVSARTGEGLEALRAHALAPAAPRPAWPGRPDPDRLDEIERLGLTEAADLCARAVSGPEAGLLKSTARSIALDRFVFHPVAGPLILAAALFAVFQSLFALGAPLGEAITAGIGAVSEALKARLPWPWAASLLCDGVLPGISAVAGFVPQIALLFALIGLLEASGYLPRAGAMVDRALRPFGLDGRVFIPFLSAFACAIPGVMAARTIPNERRRLTALLLVPLMTCSARLPVYTLLIAAFVPASWRPLGLSGQGLVMAGMYLLGVAVALALALVLKHTRLHEASPSPVTVLPPYRWPSPRELGRYVWLRCWHFLSRAGRVIFALSVLLWALASFPKAGGTDAEAWRAEAQALRAAPAAGEDARARLAQLEAWTASADLSASALGRAGRAVEPVFRPLGYDWRLSIAVLSSLAAREVFVGTLGTLMALGGDSAPSEGLIRALREARTEDGLPRYTLATAVSLLLFFSVALQCVSTIAIVRRETGSWTWPAAQFASFFAVAYALAFAGYRLTAWLS